MIIFVLLNLLCFFLILSRCIWADKASWNKTTHNIMSVFTPYHPQLELTQLKDEDEDDDCKNCEQCSRYDRDSDEDDSDDENPLTDSNISTPSIEEAEEEAEAEAENPENYSGSESDNSVIVLDTRVNYLKQAQDIVQGLKDELEKKND